MRFGVNDVCAEHDPGDRHPENPDRIRAIKRALQKRHGIEYVTADPADADDARAVHDADYVDEIREFCADGGGSWDPDTVAVEATWRAALASAGLAMWTADAALDGDGGRTTPFSLGRPPGHHAVEDDAMGFCFLNNAAVASQYALDTHDVERVVVFDWDVHHGNGTQDIFYDRGDVFYGSIHEDGLYPGTGDIEETGTGDGAGATMNAPLPAGADDADYCLLFDEAFAPAIESFDPDLFLVSAGFDAHRHDPISRMHVSTDGYGVLTTRVRDLAERCDAALSFVLEGGYSLDTLSEGVGMVHEVFDGLVPEGPDTDPSDEAADVLDDVRDAHGLGSK